MPLATTPEQSASPAASRPVDTGSPGAPPGSAGRALAVGAALVLILGSVLFLSGGRVHPAIGAAVGAGPDAFFQAFAEKVRQTHGWHTMHMLILVGPLCWAVAAPALLDGLLPEARPLTSIARSALLLSGALWAVAFVIDGFGAPVYAEAVAAAASPELARGVLTSFAAHAVMMSRLGLVSLVAGGLGMVVLGGLLLAPRARTTWRIIVGVAGIAVGLWPLLAALKGEYAGGPFTSSFWLPNAIALALWYIALGTCAFGKGPRRA